MIYGKNIFYKVLKLYGKDSDIFKAMAKGEKISSMIKASYNKRCPEKISRIRVKNNLFEKCKKDEDAKPETNIVEPEDDLSENLI